MVDIFVHTVGVFVFNTKEEAEKNTEQEKKGDPALEKKNGREKNFTNKLVKWVGSYSGSAA